MYDRAVITPSPPQRGPSSRQNGSRFRQKFLVRTCSLLRKPPSDTIRTEGRRRRFRALLHPAQGKSFCLQPSRERGNGRAGSVTTKRDHSGLGNCITDLERLSAVHKNVAYQSPDAPPIPRRSKQSGIMRDEHKAEVEDILRDLKRYRKEAYLEPSDRLKFQEPNRLGRAKREQVEGGVRAQSNPRNLNVDERAHPHRQPFHESHLRSQGSNAGNCAQVFESRRQRSAFRSQAHPLTLPQPKIIHTSQAYPQPFPIEQLAVLQEPLHNVQRHSQQYTKAEGTPTSGFISELFKAYNVKSHKPATRRTFREKEVGKPQNASWIGGSESGSSGKKPRDVAGLETALKDKGRQHVMLAEKPREGRVLRSSGPKGTQHIEHAEDHNIATEIVEKGTDGGKEGRVHRRLVTAANEGSYGKYTTKSSEKASMGQTRMSKNNGKYSLNLSSTHNPEQEGISLSNLSVLKHINSTLGNPEEQSVEDIHYFFVAFYQRTKSMLRKVEEDPSPGGIRHTDETPQPPHIDAKSITTLDAPMTDES